MCEEDVEGGSRIYTPSPPPRQEMNGEGCSEISRNDAKCSYDAPDRRRRKRRKKYTDTVTPHLSEHDTHSQACPGFPVKRAKQSLKLSPTWACVACDFGEDAETSTPEIPKFLPEYSIDSSATYSCQCNESIAV